MFVFTDYGLFRKFDNALIDFDKYLGSRGKSREDLIFLVPIGKAHNICGRDDINHGDFIGNYKGVPVMCEQYTFEGLWVRHLDNIYYKTAEF